MTLPALLVYLDGPIAVTADNLNTFVQSCDDANDMRGLTGITGMSLLARGLDSAGDGGGGNFYWNATATGPDDNLNTIMPYGSTQGAWLRQTSEAQTVNASGASTGITTGVTTAMCSLTLTAGVWAVSGSVLFTPQADSTTIQFLLAGLNASPANITASQFLALTYTTGSTNNINTGTALMNVAAPTLVTLEASASFGVTGMNATGTLQAVKLS